ncbi:hypothetical protein [Neobacillus sp. 19]|uniref:hypothetical protein n=1 Tax=Neobacillus sp. 19 TaxID=3394458 RepID=UPI003BF769D9
MAGNQIYCKHCGDPIKYPQFNFCTHCGQRIIDERNTDDVEELIHLEVRDRNGGYKPPFPVCDRCSFPPIFADEDVYCSMCGSCLMPDKINKSSSTNEFIEKGIGLNERVMIDLGRFTDYYLEKDEICLFYQEDVCWYEYTTNYRDELYVSTSMNIGNIRYTAFTKMSDGEPDNIWNSRAAGTLYLTNKKVILYDKGFSNIWTKLIVEGDFPEQVMCFPLEEITNIQRSMNFSNSGLVGTKISTIYGECILTPSHRKYRGRRTPRMNEYPSLQEFSDKIFRLL